VGRKPPGSSNLPLGAFNSSIGGVFHKKEKYYTNTFSMSDFENFLCVQKNLSGVTLKNHVRYLGIFLRSVRKSSDSTWI
jgi:hypothetical protein